MEQRMNEQEIAEIRVLNKVIKHAIEAVEKSKEQIFEIAEHARVEGNNLKRELEQVKKEVAEVIALHDQLELKYKRSRIRLMEVSRNLHRFTEQEIREAYERASQIQLELQLAREREKYLRQRRDELQLRLRNMEVSLERAENLMTQLGVVMSYLEGDIARMTEELEKARHGQLFGLKIIQAQEEERKRVAREMHDGPAQSMANVVLRADLIEKIMNQGNIEQAREELRELKNLVRQCLADVRRIIFDLRPMALDDLGLIPTLRKFVEGYSERYGLKIDFRTDGCVKRLPSSMEVAIFRLIQESLNNIVKHAQADLAVVQVEFESLKLVVTVADNGIGFSEEKVDRNKHFGLMGMRERVKLLDGTMQLASVPGRGTVIRIGIPLPDEDEKDQRGNPLSDGGKKDQLGVLLSNRGS